MRKRTDMREYQVRAADKLYHGLPLREPETGRYMWERPERDGTAVHIDMGLGKTVIGLTAIVDWYAFGVLQRPTLVIAPIKVCEAVWRQEAQREWEHTRHLTFSLIRGDEKARSFAMHPNRGAIRSGLPCWDFVDGQWVQNRYSHVYLINPEGLQWLAKFLRNDWSYFDALLIDESSMFKDNRAKRFRVLSNYGTRVALQGPDGKALRDAKGDLILTPPHRFKRSGVLTGTPSPSSLMNLWAPLYLIDHGARLHAKFDTFKGRYFHKSQQVAEHVHKYDLNDGEDEARPEYQARDGAPEKIHEMIADVTVELNAEDYGVLPQTIGDATQTQQSYCPITRQQVIQYPPNHTHWVELPDALKVQYKQLEREAVLELDRDPIMAANGGAKSMMCWQFANGAIHRTDDFGKRTWANLHNAKVEKLVELVETLNTNFVIPYYFTHDLERITQAFQAAGIPYATLKGGKTERIVDRWNAGHIPNLLLHPQSAGHGLNLQKGGHTLIWFTMLWSLERYLQTNARLARSGQSGIVGIHHILTRDTTDVLQYLNLGEKGDDQTRFRSALRSYQQLRGLGLYDAATPN